jgi:hypothetical protein
VVLVALAELDVLLRDIHRGHGKSPWLTAPPGCAPRPRPSTGRDTPLEAS